MRRNVLFCCASVQQVHCDQTELVVRGPARLSSQRWEVFAGTVRDAKERSQSSSPFLGPFSRRQLPRSAVQSHRCAESHEGQGRPEVVPLKRGGGKGRATLAAFFQFRVSQPIVATFHLWIMNRATWPPSHQAVHARNAANNSNRLYNNTALQHMQPPRNDMYLNSSDDLATIYSAFSRA